MIIRGQSLCVTGKRQATKVAFDEFVATYAKYRRPSPSVVRHIVDNVALPSVPTILDVGCGTGNYLSCIRQEYGGRAFGLDKSPAMLHHALLKDPSLCLTLTNAEKGIPYVENSFDFVFMVDVIHYIQDLETFFGELFRVLREGALLLIVTVSEEDLRGQTMAQYFPETVEIELGRHPSISSIVSHMETVGLKEIRVTHTQHKFRLNSKDLSVFRSKTFSALWLISDESFRRGIAKLEEDVAKGKSVGNEFHTFVWGQK